MEIKSRKDIKLARIKAELTLEKSAEKLGVSKSHLWDIEHGKCERPKVELLKRMAKLYGVAENELLIACKRLPTEIYYKIFDYPEIIEYIKSYERKK